MAGHPTGGALTINEWHAAIERTAARDVGRGSEALASHVVGSLQRAGESLLAASPLNAVIVTGFFIPSASTPACETDGPIGAVQLATAILALGGQARLLTDSPCERVIRAAIDAAEIEVPLDVAPLPAAVGRAQYEEWEAHATLLYDPATHMISIERVGPSIDGVPRNMRGADITAHTAPLWSLYAVGSWVRIGIGDGGNELGMGSLPREVVSGVVPRGDDIHCVVSCDDLIVSATSNWGASALVASLAIQSGFPPALTRMLKPEWSEPILRSIVQQAGAVDGVLGHAALSVDGLSWPAYASRLEEIEAIVCNAARQ